MVALLGLATTVMPLITSVIGVVAAGLPAKIVVIGVGALASVDLGGSVVGGGAFASVVFGGSSVGVGAFASVDLEGSVVGVGAFTRVDDLDGSV